MEAIDITPGQRKTILTVLKRHLPGVEVWAFGSRVKWTSRPESDLDLVVLSSSSQRTQVSALKEALEGSDMSFRVDVLVWDELPKSFQKNIREEHVVFLEKQEDRETLAGWRKARLGTVARINPEQKGADREHGEISYIDISSVGTGVFNETPRRLTLSEAPSRAQRIVKDKDTLLSTVRPNRRSFLYLKSPAADTLASTGFAVLRPTPEIDPRFLYYTISRHEFTDYLDANTHGSAYPAVSPEVIGNAEIELPPLHEQRAIARILGSLDDLIDLNRRTNDTLEQIARALFSHYFPYSPEEDLPKGWRVGELADCCIRIENGGTPRRNISEYWSPAEVPWLTSGEVRQRIVIETENRISREGLDNSSAKIWPPLTTVVALYGATAGQVTLIASEMCSNQACCALIAKVAWQHFTYLIALSCVQRFEQQARGSAQQNLSQGLVADLEIVVPPDSVVEEFDALVRPIIGQWIENIETSRTIAALRDVLLPKLVAGGIRVPEVAT